MNTTVFFSFNEKDRDEIELIKARAMNPVYKPIQFQVVDLLKRWKVTSVEDVKKAIQDRISNSNKTIVFVGKSTHKSFWVECEVEETICNGKMVHAIFLEGQENSKIPRFLKNHLIPVHSWSEQKLQEIVHIKNHKYVY